MKEQKEKHQKIEEKKKEKKTKEIAKPVSKKSDTSISIKLKPPKEPKEEKKPKIEPIKDVTTVTIKTDEKKPYLVTNSTGDTVVSYFDDDTVWICPKCGKEDDGSEMIGCDKCPDWYHNLCVGIKKVPEGSWFCPKCSKGKKKAKRK